MASIFDQFRGFGGFGGGMFPQAPGMPAPTPPYMPLPLVSGMAGMFAPAQSMAPADPNATSQAPSLFQPPQQQQPVQTQRAPRQPQPGEAARGKGDEGRGESFWSRFSGLGGDSEKGGWSGTDLASLAGVLLDAGAPSWNVNQPSGYARAANGIANITRGVEERGDRAEDREAARADRAYTVQARGREATQREALDAAIAALPPEQQAWARANPEAAGQVLTQRNLALPEHRVEGGFEWTFNPQTGALTRGEEVPMTQQERERLRIAGIAASRRGGNRELTPSARRQFRNDYERQVADAREGTARANLALGFARTALSNDGRIPGDDETVRNSDAALLFVTARLIQGTGVLSDPDIQILSGAGLDSVLADVEGFVSGSQKLSARQRYSLSQILTRHADQLTQQEWNVYDDHAAFAEELGYRPEELGLRPPRSQRPGSQETPTDDEDAPPSPEDVEAEIQRRGLNQGGGAAFFNRLRGGDVGGAMNAGRDAVREFLAPRARATSQPSAAGAPTPGQASALDAQGRPADVMRVMSEPQEGDVLISDTGVRQVFRGGRWR